MNKTQCLANVILVITVLGAALCSCKSPSDPKEPAIVTFAIPETATFVTEANFEGLVQAFNRANPDIEVQLRAITIQEMMKAGNNLYTDVMLDEEWGIDVFFSDGVFTRYLVNQSQVLDLQPLLETDPNWELDDFYSSALAQFRHANDLWGIPTEFIPLVMFYNKDLFDEARVVYPQPGWTRDDFLETAVALKPALLENDFAFVGMGEAAALFVYAHKGDLFGPRLSCVLDDPLTIEALEWYFDLALVHKVMPTLAQVEVYEPELPPDVLLHSSIMVTGNGEIVESIRRIVEANARLNQAGRWGDAAMWLAPFGEQGGQQPDQLPWRFDWGVVPLPQDEVEVNIFATYGCYITAHSKYPKQALRWIQYLTQHRVDMSGIPARRSLAQSAVFREALSQEIDGPTFDGLLSQMEQGQIVPFTTLTTVNNDAIFCLADAMIDIYEQGENVETALFKAQQRLSDD